MRSEPYLHKNDRGIWEIRWTEPGANGTSRSRKLSTHAASDAEAKELFTQWVKDREAALEIFADPTVAECIGAYRKYARTREGGIHISQLQILARWERSSIASLRPGQLSGKPLRDWRLQRRQEVKESSWRRELSALSAALNYAGHPDKCGLLEAGAVPKILLPNPKHEEKPFLDEENEKAFLEAALRYSPRVGRFVMLGLNTGARREALHDVTWDRVDLPKRRIDFRVPGRKENNKKRVVAVINPRLLPFLEAIPERDRWGRVIGNADIRVAFERFVELSKWPWVTAHTMRHSFITLALRAGVDIWDVAGMVGDSVATLERHYAHHKADSRMDAAANRRFL
jgi:integrase